MLNSTTSNYAIQKSFNNGRFLLGNGFLRICTVLLLLVVAQSGIGQVARWNFFGQSSPVTLAATATNSNVTVSTLTRGAGAASSAASNSFRTTGFQNNGISTANTDYFQFTIKANTGYTLSLTSIASIFNGTATFFATPGVTSQYAYSTDGTTFTLIGSPVTQTGLSLSTGLSGVSALQTLPAATTVTIRYYASGQTATGGWGYTSASASTGDDGLSIAGTVTPVAATPTVSLSVSSNTGSEAAPAAITVTATASAAVTGAQTVTLAVSGTNITGGDYSLSGTTITIPNGGTTGTQTFTVVDDALVEGTETATLTISGPSSGITLGTPVTQNITITDNDAAPVPEINLQQGVTNIASGGTYGFSSISTGSSSAVTTFTIQNTGTANLTLSGSPIVAISGTNAAEFTVNQAATTSPVTASGSTTFTITFSPTTAGSKTATISIANTDADENPYTFTITGSSTLAVPVATAATNVLATAFSANWNAVTGATGYRLDVSTSPTFGTTTTNTNQTLIQNSGTIGQSGWSETSITQQGGAAAYLGLLFSTSTLITPQIDLANSSNISLNFLARTFGGVSAANNIITVSISTDNGGNWTTLGTRTPASSTLISVTAFSLNTYAGMQVKIRFQTLGASGTVGAGIDDITVIADQTVITPSFVAGYENLAVSGTSQAVIVSTCGVNYYYRVRGTDGTNTSTNSNTITVTNTVPTAPTVSITQPTCATATGTITVTSSLTGLSFSIDGSTYTNTTGVFTVAAGSYSVTAKNASGCISSATSAVVNAQPATPTAPTISITQPSCATATGTITVTSSLTGLSFSIDGSTYTNTSGVFTVASGSYSLTAKNASGCISSATSAVVNAQPATPSAPTVSITQPTCATATGTITVTSSLTGLSFSIDGSTYTNTTGIFTVAANTTYPVTAKNASGCISSATSAMVNAQPATPVAPTISITQPTITVQTGTVTISAPTGSGFTYSSDGSDYTNTTGTLAGLTAGNTYSITAKNASGCISPATSAEIYNNPVIADYKTKATGNFSSASIWEYNDYGTHYVAATAAPTSTNNVTILHKITLDQDYTVGSGKTFTLDSLLLANSDTFTIKAGKTLTIAGIANINNRRIRLESTAAGTGAIGNITGTILQTATGQGEVSQFMIERYIPANASRAWRLLSVPTKGSQNMHSSWQENSDPLVDSKPGYGTIITSKLANWATKGFDAKTSDFSVKTTNSSGALVGVTATDSAGYAIETRAGYFIYIRGDRSVTPSSSTTSVNATTLRTYGTLYYGNQSNITALANQDKLVGNIYPSAIDLRLLTTDHPAISIWDAKLGGLNGVGAYRTLTYDGTNYIVTPANKPDAGTIENTIQSGQAFFVSPNGSNSTVSFTENVKTSASSAFNVFDVPGANAGSLYTNLYAVSDKDSLVLADGTLNVFNDQYNTAIDNFDARKLTNIGENFYIRHHGNNLIVNKSGSLTANDTIYFGIERLRSKFYELQVFAAQLNANGMTGWLQDSFTGENTPLNLNGTTSIRFTYDPSNTASKDVNRFKIIFKQDVILAVSYTGVKGYRENENISVEWKVSKQKDISSYTIEKSVNGTVFVNAGTKAATGVAGETVSYKWQDIHPTEGDNFYRIKGTDVNGGKLYSQVVKVAFSKTAGVSIYPNLITNGVINLHLNGMEKGNYTARLLSANGALLFTKQVSYNGGSEVHNITVSQRLLPNGRYFLEIIQPDKSSTTRPVMFGK